MTHTVKDDDPMGRLRLADPVDPEELERTVGSLRSRVMRSAIERGGSPTQPIPDGDRVAVALGARAGRAGRTRRGARRNASWPDRCETDLYGCRRPPPGRSRAPP